MAIQTDFVAGETLVIGDDIEITLLDKSGKRARVSVSAPKTMPVTVRQPHATAHSHIASVGMLGTKP